MKTQTLVAGLFAILLAVACKDKETPPGSDAEMNDTIAQDTTQMVGTGTAGASASTSEPLYRHQPGERGMTQPDLDSIKAERDKLVTPPSHTGASLTPGSGTAVPGNNQVSGGTNADMGSSTGK